jgi:V8-like Glu-specific endopeptidase
MNRAHRSLRTILISLLISLIHGLAVAQCDCGCKHKNDAPGVASRVQQYNLSSGDVQHSGTSSSGEVVFKGLVRIADAEWLRLSFHELVLAGDPATENASVLRITSIKDGHVQFLNAHTAKQWSNTSAYFNGSTLLLEIVAFPNTGPSRLTMQQVTVGEIPVLERSICGPTDDRILSNDPRAARLMSVGCTAWLHNDLNRTFLSAGHCTVNSSSVVQFNVPLSNANGSVNHPGPEDQYPVEMTSNQGNGGGTGNDWRYFGAFPNSNHGLTAFQRQGDFYIKASVAPPVQGQLIRITGYGTVSSPVSPTWNQVQKTHAGPYVLNQGTLLRYQADTTGGNSGSAVVDESTGLAIGIHTHAGCTSTGGSNQGTAIHLQALQNALANPLGVCRSGGRPVSPPLYLAGDLNNNFGTVNTTNGGFGKISDIPTTMQGLAFDRNAGIFYLSDHLRRLYRVTPGGSATLLGTISGTTQVINGLAYDPNNQVLYGISQSNGQLYSINTASLAATSIGTPGGGQVGGIDFDASSGKLFGLTNASGVTRLIEINPMSGAQTLVSGATFGTGACHGLAWNDRDGLLYTVNASNGQAFVVNPTTGVGTLLGSTFGMFGVAHGMAVEQLPVETTVLPTELQIRFGSLISGGLSQLAAADQDYLRLARTFVNSRENAGVEFDIAGSSSIASPSSLKFRLKVRVTAVPAQDVVQRILLWNFATSSWEIVDARPSSSVDESFDVTIASNPGRFVQPGTGSIRARLQWFDAPTLLFRGWEVHVDQAVWILNP